MKIYRTSIYEHAREMKTMLPEMKNLFTAAVLVLVMTVAGLTAEAASKQKSFATPEDAVKAFIDAIRSNDSKELLTIFGEGAKDLMYSGDPVSDKERRKKGIEAFDKKNSLVKEGEKMVLVIGENDWPFPIPLVKQGEKWIFDTKAGRVEILNRRIGQNELSTIRTMHEIVDAEREYAMVDRDGDGLVEYAGKFLSDPGKKNGLYWQTKEGEEPSPLGELVAKAKAGGYTKSSTQKPVPYNGYYYLMLNKQGKNASGGAFDYVVKGKQIAGFAVVAYPAKYGNSGVMTFMVNQDGVVYQKDLGRNTEKAAKVVKKFDPDKTWKKVE
jgi:hypothetical protein